jgi:predicted phage terminase large subunit-like protein
MFCLIYLSHHFFRPPAVYHPEMMLVIDDDTIKNLLIIGHRGSAKSTIASLAYPIYAALEKPHLYPFIVPLSDTTTQAAINIANIKNELENNDLLINDYGKIGHATVRDPSPEPTFESEEDWQAKNMILSNGVRILARSRGQKIRGLKHRQNRISLAILDDVEDVAWVKTKENRNTTDRWMRGEVMGAMDELNGRIIGIGNWLHEDALMARLKKLSQFKVLEYPLIKDIDGEEYVTWPALYPDQESIDSKREKMGEIAWMREMLMKIVPEDGQEVKIEDIHYYDEEPEGVRGSLKAHGVDLAISTKDSADFTTDVQGNVHYDENDKPKIYIQKNPLNAHLDFYHTIEYFKGKPRGSHLFFVEDVAYQKAAIQEMERNLIAVIAVKPIADKRARLRVAARYIKNGTVLFPRKGCEKLIEQLLNFGSAEKDDLVDGLVNLILGAVGEGLEIKRVVVLK